MTKTEKIIIIIPAFNEAQNIGFVIDQLKFYVPYADIVVINDGSNDETGLIARSKDVFVLNLPYNLGIGGAVQTGYKFASEHNYQIAIQVDGDGQHPAEEIEKLIDQMKEYNADMIVGSRYLGVDYPEFSFFRGLAKWLLASVISFLTGQSVSDCSSGFRAVNQKIIRLFSKWYPKDYPEPETVAFLIRKNFIVKEIPIAMKDRNSGTSSISFYQGVYYVIKVIIATIIRGARIQ